MPRASYRICLLIVFIRSVGKHSLGAMYCLSGRLDKELPTLKIMKTSLEKVAYEANEILHQFKQETRCLKSLLQSSPKSINWWARFLGLDPSGIHYRFRKNNWTPSDVIHIYERMKILRNFDIEDLDYFDKGKFSAPVDPKRELDYY